MIDSLPTVTPHKQDAKEAKKAKVNKSKIFFGSRVVIYMLTHLLYVVHIRQSKQTAQKPETAKVNKYKILFWLQTCHLVAHTSLPTVPLTNRLSKKQRRQR